MSSCDALRGPDRPERPSDLGQSKARWTRRVRAVALVLSTTSTAVILLLGAWSFTTLLWWQISLGPGRLVEPKFYRGQAAVFYLTAQDPSAIESVKVLSCPAYGGRESRTSGCAYGLLLS